MFTARMTLTAAAALLLSGMPLMAQTTAPDMTTPDATTPDSTPPAADPMIPDPTTPENTAPETTAPANTAPDMTAPDMAPAGTATTAPVDCAAEFTALDLDGNGRLSEAEAGAAYARARVDGVTLNTEGMSADDYAAICGSDRWQTYMPEEGAPFEGANSFTEEQARDRAVSWNFTDVSALAQDEQGIWRGTAMQNGQSVDIAVDYKGNVVATPKN